MRSGGDGILPAANDYADEDNELKEKILSSVASMKDSISGMKIDKGIGAVIESVRAVNKYFEKSAPWKLATENNSARLDTVLYTAAEALRIISGILHPVMPGKMCELRRSLGIEEEACMKIRIEGLQHWGLLQAGTKLRDCSSLFQRIDVKDAKKEKNKAAPATVPAPENSEEQGLVSIDEFFKTKLMAAKIIAAEKVEGADKLLKVEIDIGSEKRSIVSGIAQHYSPADIIGKTIVLVSNLKPAKIRGIESRGMLLAAKNGKDLKLVIVEGDIPSGSSVG